MQVILHVDFDSFFASVEQQCNPRLRGVPLGVTATNGRTCIIAASREAKQFGIKTGSRTQEAFPRCPHLQLVSADFGKYYEISKKFLAICQAYTPFVELFSIDEVFMDVTATAHLFGGPEKLVRQLKAELAATIGSYITVSVGISYNKLLAKLASGIQKPNGMFTITPKNRQSVYAKATLTDICGIGQRIEQRLHTMGIYSLLQLETVPFYRLVAEFGRMEAYFLKSVGLGMDTSPVVPYTEIPGVKSIGRNYCLPENIYDQKLILKNIYEICEDIARRLRSLERKGRTVGLSLRGNRAAHGRKTYPWSMHTGKDIFAACKSLYDQWQWDNPYFPEEGMVRMMSIWIENLENTEHVTPSLFGNEQKQDVLWQTIDTLNKRFGDYTIRHGYLLYADKLKTVPNGYFADKDQRTQLALEAQEHV